MMMPPTPVAPVLLPGAVCGDGIETWLLRLPALKALMMIPDLHPDSTAELWTSIVCDGEI